MYEKNEDCFYYLTCYNENYAQPAMPEIENLHDGILRGMYKYRPAAEGKAHVQLFGSGTILNEALRAQQILSEKYQVAADVWSVTSYSELRRDARRRRSLEPPPSGRTGAGPVPAAGARRARTDRSSRRPIT